MADSYSKKEREKKRRKKKQDKAEKKKQRKLEGKTSAEFMYVDENGNLSTTPPDPAKKKKFNAEDIDISVPSSGLSLSSLEHKGYVKFYDKEKRFGFINETGGKKDYFFHEDNVLDKVQDQDKVIFEVEKGPKGPVAVSVRLFVEQKEVSENQD